MRTLSKGTQRSPIVYLNKTKDLSFRFSVVIEHSTSKAWRSDHNEVDNFFLFSISGYVRPILMKILTFQTAWITVDFQDHEKVTHLAFIQYYRMHGSVHSHEIYMDTMKLAFTRWANFCHHWEILVQSWQANDGRRVMFENHNLTQQKITDLFTAVKSDVMWIVIEVTETIS